MTESTLSAAAFGDRPGCWPLPSARTPYQRWLRAVAAGGQGRYGSAQSDLTLLLRNTSAGRLASLAHSTRARSCASLAGMRKRAGGTAGRWRWPATTPRLLPTRCLGWPPMPSDFAGSPSPRRCCAGPTRCWPAPPRPGAASGRAPGVGGRRAGDGDR
ncbi:hypothetical protein I552_8874 [Mycobacterium xenopi 3993]|nr:hypothetical protein I552_8874 [Mycobacterium xenopi 3993]